MTEVRIFERPAGACSLTARLLLFAMAMTGSAQELRPGVWAGRDLGAFPLPVSGYDVYMLGEMHGVKENEGVLAGYLAKLYERAGVRDVALEERPAYERGAQAYVEGKSNSVPEPLCLRAGILDTIRRFNEEHRRGEPVHVRLVDIDLNKHAGESARLEVPLH